MTTDERRIALVTGAAGALGTAVCERLVADGLVVVGVDLTGEDCEHFDVGSADGTREMVARVLELHGRLDVLVLNAGAQHVSPIADFEPAQWRRVMDVCLDGPFHAVRAAWPALTREPGGRVIAVASTSSFHAEPFKAAYTAAKHGLLGLVRTIAVEGAPFGLTANSVAPSWMRTPMVENQLAEQVRLRGVPADAVLAEFLDRQPVKRFVETAEVAAVIGFLASPAAAAVTGSCVPVDLGALA